WLQAITNMESSKQQRDESPEPSCVSLKSDRSKGGLILFKDGRPSNDPISKQQREESPEPSCVSLKSDRSKGGLILFKDGRPSNDPVSQQQREESPGPSCVSLKSDRSKGALILFKDGSCSSDPVEDQQSSEGPRGQSAQQHQTQLDSTFMLLEDNIITFVKNELKKIQKALSSDYPECLESQREDEEVLDGEDEEQRRSSREAFLNITLHFLRSMKQEELAERLQS
ncbi:hypothetical protein KUCAC02_033835, partial [Chaenocephalus aceratus]